jgi:hypothetical protein
MECPICRRNNRPDTFRCDCGYDFRLILEKDSDEAEDLQPEKVLLRQTMVPGYCLKCHGENPALFDIYIGNKEKYEHVVIVPICESCGSKRKWSTFFLAVLVFIGILMLLGIVLGSDTIHQNSTFLTIAAVLLFGALMRQKPLDTAKEIASKYSLKMMKEHSILIEPMEWNIADELILKEWNNLSHWSVCPSCQKLNKEDGNIKCECGKSFPDQFYKGDTALSFINASSATKSKKSK